jgi:hypothetical protein
MYHLVLTDDSLLEGVFHVHEAFAFALEKVGDRYACGFGDTARSAWVKTIEGITHTMAISSLVTLSLIPPSADSPDSCASNFA